MTILGVSVKMAGAYEPGAVAAPHIKVAGQYLPWDAEVVMIKVDGAYDLGNGSLPSNLTLPVIAGPDADPGSTLTVTPGTWDGVPTPTISLNWYVGTTPKGGGLTYVIQEADRGQPITCQERATNLVGSVFVVSNAITPPNTAFSNEFTAEFH